MQTYETEWINRTLLHVLKSSDKNHWKMFSEVILQFGTVAELIMDSNQWIKDRQSDHNLDQIWNFLYVNYYFIQSEAILTYFRSV